MLFKKIQNNKTKIIRHTQNKLINKTNKIIDLLKLSKSNNYFNLKCYAKV